MREARAGEGQVVTGLHPLRLRVGLGDLRVVDLSDPFSLKEIGHYLPKTNQNSHPITKDQPTVIQMNDVDIDHRGLAYASDRVGTGLFILEYTGNVQGTK